MNAETEMNTADGLGADPETKGQRELRELAAEIGYSDGADDPESGGVDALIDYKNALEDRFLELVDGPSGYTQVSADSVEPGDVIDLDNGGKPYGEPRTVDSINDVGLTELWFRFLDDEPGAKFSADELVWKVV